VSQYRQPRGQLLRFVLASDILEYVMQPDIEPHLHLACRLAREFSNIPGLGFAEIEMTAQEALARAFSHHDASKGEFPPYAAQAIRNALKSLYDKQVRHHRHHSYILDEMASSGRDSTQVAQVHNVKDCGILSVPEQARFNQSKALLEKLMGTLSPRHRSVLEGLRDGRSYSEIGSAMGISKQAVQKIVHSALDALREKLAEHGFRGVDSQGFVESFHASKLSGGNSPEPG
jgi:RNA polymerase sigma factor (sigma-70 family)